MLLDGTFVKGTAQFDLFQDWMRSRRNYCFAAGVYPQDLVSVELELEYNECYCEGEGISPEHERWTLNTTLNFDNIADVKEDPFSTHRIQQFIGYFETNGLFTYQTLAHQVGEIALIALLGGDRYEEEKDEEYEFFDEEDDDFPCEVIDMRPF